METIWKQRVSLRFCAQHYVLLVWRSTFTLTNTSPFLLFRFGGSKASALIVLKAIDSNCSFKPTALLSLWRPSSNLKVSAFRSMPLSGISYPSNLHGLRRTLAQWLSFRQFRHSDPYAGQLSLVLQECSRPELGHCIYLLLLRALFLIPWTSLFQSPANCLNCEGSFVCSSNVNWFFKQ